MSDIKFIVDITNALPIEYVYLRQYDVGKILTFEVVNSGVNYNLSGHQAAFSMKKSDGNYVFDVCTISDNIMTLTITSAMTTFSGIQDFTISVTDGFDRVITTIKGAFNIKEALVTDDDILSTYENTVVSTLIGGLAELNNTQAYVRTLTNSAVSSANNANNYWKLSKSYAIGDADGIREDEDTENSKYYYTKMKEISENIGGVILPQGTITFSQLIALNKSTLKAGYLYNISDAFTSDSTFKDGGDVQYPVGTNVYLTADSMWDCLSGSITKAGSTVEYVGNQTTGVRIGTITIDSSSTDIYTPSETVLSESESNPVAGSAIVNTLNNTIGWWSNKSISNLVKLSISDGVYYGVTFTNQADGTILLNGTCDTSSTGSNTIEIPISEDISIPDGTGNFTVPFWYMCTSNTSSGQYVYAYLDYYYENDRQNVSIASVSTSPIQITNLATKTYMANQTSHSVDDLKLKYTLGLCNKDTFKNFVIYPMVALTEITGKDDFVKYGESASTIQSQIDSLKDNLSGYGISINDLSSSVDSISDEIDDLNDDMTKLNLSVGTSGQFATSDGNGGITWVTLSFAEGSTF